MTAKPYHHGNLRAALIEAGLATLEQSESREISLRALAREIGVSANAAYRHFEDKDALLSALAAEGFRRFSAMQLQAMQGQPDMAVAGRASGRAYVDFALANPALFRLMFGHFLHAKTDPELRQAANAAFQGLVQASARTTGTAHDDERAVLMAILRWSLVHGLSHLVLDGQLEIVTEDVDKLINDVLALARSSSTVPTSPTTDRTEPAKAMQAVKTANPAKPPAKPTSRAAPKAGAKKPPKRDAADAP